MQFTNLVRTALSSFFLSATLSTAGLVNGSFESGLEGWTITPGVQISPFPELPASDGTYQTFSVPFTVPGDVRSLKVRFIDRTPNNGIAADPILDNVRVVHHSTELPAVLAGPITNSANGHKYFLLAGTNWTASQAQARALGGNLVTINDAQEQAWVYSTFSRFGGRLRALWIGLSDAAKEGTFVWTSGQKSPFSNWTASEPNNFDGSEHFVHIFPPEDHLGRSGLWNDFTNGTAVVYDNYSVPLHGVVEVENPVLPPSDCEEPLRLLKAQLAAANSSNAFLKAELSVMTSQNAALRTQVGRLGESNTILRAQLTKANVAVESAQKQLTAANVTIVELRRALDTLRGENAKVRQQLDSANAEARGLREQLLRVDRGVESLEDYFAERFDRPDFKVPGATTEDRVGNVLNALKRLSPAQQRAFIRLLRDSRAKPIKGDEVDDF